MLYINFNAVYQQLFGIAYEVCLINRSFIGTHKRIHLHCGMSVKLLEEYFNDVTLFEMN